MTRDQLKTLLSDFEIAVRTHQEEAGDFDYIRAAREEVDRARDLILRLCTEEPAIEAELNQPCLECGQPKRMHGGNKLWCRPLTGTSDPNSYWKTFR